MDSTFLRGSLEPERRMGSWGLDAILSFLRYERARDNANAANRRNWLLKILGQTAASTASRACLWIIVRSSANCPQEQHAWGPMGSFFILKLIYCLSRTQSLHFCDLLIGHPWLQIQIIDPSHISLRRKSRILLPEGFHGLGLRLKSLCLINCKDPDIWFPTGTVRKTEFRVI